MINVRPSSSIRVLGVGEEYRVTDLLSALDERAALRARLAIYEKDGGGVVPVNGGRCVEVYQEGEMVELDTSEAGDEVIALRARVAELEAPPVVPSGYEVVKVDHEDAYGEREPRWELRVRDADDELITVAYVGDAGEICSPYCIAEPFAALAALDYARRTGECPPHERDKS